MDEELILCIQRQGDRAALARLIERDQREIYHFLMRQLGHAQDAEDAAQEVFRHVIRGLPCLCEPAAYRAWLYRIALRTARQMIAKRKSRQETTPQESSIPSREAMPHDDACDELRTQLRSAVDSLEENLRATILLRYEQGLSYKEIASTLEVPEGTVARRLHVAHNRLQQALAGAGISLALASLAEALEKTPKTSMPENLTAKLSAMAKEASWTPLAATTTLIAAIALIAISAILVVGGIVAADMFPRQPVSQPASGSVLAASQTAPPTQDAPPITDTATEETERMSDVATTVDQEATLKGCAYDRETGTRLAGVHVSLSSPHTSRGPISATAVSDSDGAYAFSVPPGEYSLSALTQGYVPFHTERQIAAIRTSESAQNTEEYEHIQNQLKPRLDHGETRTQDISLIRSTEIHVTVVDEHGTPIAEAFVCLGAFFHAVSHGAITYTTESRSDISGKVRFDDLYPEGTWTIAIKANW
ncbi:MAG: sigma-70 family RNA polymerase sigma factor [Planctomycetes bacterium]|nr:sigma-70 family RNA polymerase sigma factor [Planctomycetota bacterium]